MKNRIILTVLALMMILSLCACQSGTVPGGETSDAATTAAPETEAPLPDAEVIKGGEGFYTVVRAEKSSDAFIESYKTFQNTIATVTGVQLKLGTDWVKTGTEPDPALKEILVGDTNRPETAAVKAGLTYKDFAVKVTGNKIVIVGGSAEATASAMTYFLDHYVYTLKKDGVKNADGTYDLIIKPEMSYLYEHNYSVKQLTIGGKDIKDYVIVISKDATYTDKALADSFYTLICGKVGFALPTVTDAEAASGCEILIGPSSRAESEKAQKALKAGEYSITVDGQKLVLAYADYMGASDIENYLESTVVTGKVAEVALAAADSVTKTASYSNKYVRKADGADIRILFHNVWGNTSGTVDNRDDMTAEVYRLYAPDVIGCQEFSSKYRSEKLPLTSLISDLYAEVKVDSNGDNNFTPLFYLKDKYDIVDSGYHKYSGLNDGGSKSVTWAVFEDKTTKVRFAVCSTHLYYTSDDAGNAARLTQAGELIEIENKIIAKYKVPVISGGDFNCNTSSQPYAKLISAGFTDVQNIASLYATKSKTYHSYPTYDSITKLFSDAPYPTGAYDKSIDHIFLAGTGASPLVYDFISDTYALNTSDHTPIYADFKLGE